MEVQRPQPSQNVCIHLVFHSVRLNSLVTIRTIPASSGADAHPYHPLTIIGRR